MAESIQYIYFMAMEPYNGMVAIGQTTDCLTRLEELQVVNSRMRLLHRTVLVMGITLASIYNELYCHKLYGEWFHMARDILNNIIMDYTWAPNVTQRARTIRQRGIDMEMLLQAQEGIIARLQDGLGVTPPTGEVTPTAKPVATAETKPVDTAVDANSAGSICAFEWIDFHPVTKYEGLDSYYGRYCADGGHLGLLQFGSIVRHKRYINVREEIEYLIRD